MINSSIPTLSIRSSLLLLVVFLVGCQSAQQPAILTETGAVTAPTEAYNSSIEPISQSAALVKDEQAAEINDLWERLRQGFELQQHYSHPTVQTYIENYANNQRLFDLVVERASPFLFSIIEEVERRGLPLELALLPIVESTFNPNASSSESAVGLWQFMAATARSFGVQQDWWYDGRRDPVVSTIAALEYLSQLHQQFSEDWLVAMAAYNTGDGNVRRAIRRDGQSMDDLNFWDLPLAPETRSHVPKLLAIAAVVSNITPNSIELERIPNQPQLQKVELENQIDLAHAASLAGVGIEELKALNPGFLQWATHPDQPQSILVPISKAGDFQKAISEADSSEFMTWDRYEIKNGDTLGQIARNLGTRVDIIQTANNLRNSRIVAGDSLLIPRNINSLSQLAGTNDLRNINQHRYRFLDTPERYIVKHRDNLWSIARKFDMKSSTIAEDNGFSLNSLLQPGQILRLSKSIKATAANRSIYSVQTGDSIALIAGHFGLSIDSILQWNNISSNEIIYPGQLIRLTPPESGTN
ncbi:MAG: LysM peptidoglycan-binding domain-containing protein [Pseudohongiellaceae bacterium]